MIGVQNVKADVVPTPSTPTAGNSYYLYNPKTKSFLVSDGYSNDGTPYVRSLGQAWAVESSDKDGYIKLRRKDKETGYFWGKYWALVGSNYSEYPNETYFRLDLIPETSNYHIYANSWDGTANAFVYVNSSNSNRVACNSQEQGGLDADYTVWQFITEADYATYAKEANITYSFSELSPVDYTTKGSTPTGGHTYVLYNQTNRFMYDDANTPKVSSSKYTYFTLETTASEFYIRSDAGLLYKSADNAWTTSTNGGYSNEAKWTATLSNGKYTLRNHTNSASEFFAPNSNGEGQICYRNKTALTGWYFIEKEDVALSLLDALQQAKDTYYTPAPAGEAKDNLLIALNDVYVKYVIVSGFTSDIYDAGVQAINDAVLAAIESQTESGGSLTYLLSNPSFETDDAAASLMTGNTAPTGWNFSGNATNSQWGTANGETTIQGIGAKFNPSDGEKYYYIRSNWQTNQDYTLSKTIKGLPAGVYRVSSKIARFLSHATTTYTLSLQEAGKTESKTTTDANDANWRPWQVFVKKIEDGTDLTIKANMRFDYANNGYHYQMLLDNFDFEYLGAGDEENYDFAAGAIPNGNEIKGYIHDISNATTMTSGMQYVPGWELNVTNGDTRAAGVMNINSGSKLNGSDVPAANYDGNSNGKVLALEAVWSGTVQYKKNVTLDAGSYQISFPIYNVAGTGSITKNLFGFIENGGTEHLATEVSFTTGNWAVMTVVFNLENDTEGYLSLGYTAANANNASMPHLFLDRVDINYVDPKVPARNDLQNKINEATGARKSANEGTGIFQIPAAAGTTFGNAITTAQDVYNNEDATLDEITTATSTLNAAIETYGATTLNAPAAEKRYCIVLSNNGGWTYDGKAITYLANARNDMGNYNVQYLAAPNANYAQAIIFTQVEGNTYKMSQIDVEGNERYICTGKQYTGGNTSQIRTITDASKALVVRIEATGTANIFNIYNTEANQYIGSQDAGVYTVNSNKNFTISEAFKATAKMQVSGVAKMGTFCAPFDVAIPSGVKAYTLSEGTSDSWVHMDEVSGTTIAAGTPVLLTSDSKIDKDMEGYSVINAPDNSGLLQGAFVLTDVDENAGNYLLQYQDGECAFYLVNSDGKKIGANRCYLHIEKSGETPARIVIGGGDDPTAINAVEAAAPEANTLKDGKYLIGNKIVLVKNGVKYDANGQKLN